MNGNDDDHTENLTFLEGFHNSLDNCGYDIVLNICASSIGNEKLIFDVNEMLRLTNAFHVRIQNRILRVRSADGPFPNTSQQLHPASTLFVNHALHRIAQPLVLVEQQRHGQRRFSMGCSRTNWVKHNRQSLFFTAWASAPIA